MEAPHKPADMDARPAAQAGPLERVEEPPQPTTPKGHPPPTSDLVEAARRGASAGKLPEGCAVQCPAVRAEEEEV